MLFYFHELSFNDALQATKESAAINFCFGSAKFLVATRWSDDYAPGWLNTFQNIFSSSFSERTV